MKKYIFLLILSLFVLKSYAQVPQTKSVTISPLAGNVEEVKGNIKATGIIESNTLKASGLASGNPYVANPVYANLDGTLVTGYKTGYLSIPSSAFRINYDINTDGNVESLGKDFVFYASTGLFFWFASTNRNILSPLQVPHKSKLSSMKITYNSNSPRSITVKILKVDMNDFSSETVLLTHTLALSSSYLNISENIPLNLLEIDNQNFAYSILITSSTNDWTFLSLRGICIEYQDL
jgi:hypothetical protein